jgi:hypothetical protein
MWILLIDRQERIIVYKEFHGKGGRLDEYRRLLIPKLTHKKHVRQVSSRV